MKSTFVVFVVLAALCTAQLAFASPSVALKSLADPDSPAAASPFAQEAPVEVTVPPTQPNPPQTIVVQPPTNVVQPPSNQNAPVSQGLSPEIERILSYTATAVLCFVGLIFVFAGYRIFKVALFLLGFITFFAVIWIVLDQHAQVWVNSNLWWLCYVIPALAGLVGGFMFLCIVKIGVFFSGFVLGVALGGILLATPLGTKVVTTYWIHVVIVAGAGLVLGVLALFLEKALIIIGTSAFGSYMIAVGIDMTFSKPRVLSAILENFFSGQNINLNWDDIKSNPLPYALIAGMVVFCIAGIIVQFCYTGRNYDHKRGRNRKRDQFPYDDSTQPLLPA